MNRKEEVIVKESTSPTTIVVLVAFIWALLGLLAFVTSVVCFAYNGTFLHNWVGFLTSIVLGPFYWIYYAYADPTYCSKSSGRKLAIQKKFTKKGGKKV